MSQVNTWINVVPLGRNICDQLNSLWFGLSYFIPLPQQGETLKHEQEGGGTVMLLALFVLLHSGIIAVMPTSAVGSFLVYKTSFLRICQAN